MTKHFFIVLFYYTVAAILLILFFPSCSTPKIYERGALIDLVVRPYPEKVGLLINQRCIEYKKGKCTKTNTKEWDLRNENDRKELIEQRFHCNVGGKRFGICADYNGLCHTIPYRKSWFHSWQYPIYDYIDAEAGFTRMINSNTICASMDSYVGRNLFNPEIK